MPDIILPSISVITVCLNASETIRDTIESVIRQKYSNVEYIIVDGDSTDQTLNIVAEYRRHISLLISEQDEGIYDAMNKGIEAAKGDVLYFLNADDRFMDDDVLIDVAREFSQDAGASLIYGNIVWQKNDITQQSNQPDRITREYLARKTLFHQSAFMKRNLFQRVGRYNIDYRVVADYRWFLDYFMKYEGNYRYIDRLIAYVSTSGISNSTSWEAERIDAMKDMFSHLEIIRFRKIPRLAARIRGWLKGEN